MRNKIFSKFPKYSISSVFWFMLGFVLTGLFLTGFIMSFVKFIYQNKAYEGIYVGNVYVGGKTKSQIKSMFESKNLAKANTQITFYLDGKTATFSAQQLDAGYDKNLIDEQVYSLGRTNDVLTNFYMIVNTYLYGMSLPKSYSYSFSKVKDLLDPIEQSIYKEPVDALFTVKDSRVIAFRQSENGSTIDYDGLNNIIQKKNYPNDGRQGK